MPDDTSASTLNPAGATNGASPGMPNAAEGAALLGINKRLPKGENLPDYAVEYFNQLVAQYLTLPVAEKTARNANAVTVAEGLIKEQELEKAEQDQQGVRWPWERKSHYLNWADVSGMEMAVLQLMPEAYLQRHAWNLRARYHEVAGQSWYDFYQQSKPPNDAPPSKEEDTATVSITRIPPGASGVFLLTPATLEPAGADPQGDSPAAVELRADLSILLGDLQRLRSTIKAREEKRSRISLIGALLAAVSLTLALGFYGAPSLYGEWTARHRAPTASSSPGKPTAPAAPQTTPGAAPVTPTAGTPPRTAAGSATTTSSPLQILQLSALVILCGVLGGLISMLRRLQALPPGSTPLLDTIALDAGQFGIGLAPIYGGIFAMVLYMVFLSGLPTSIIAVSAQGVFPKFTDAIPASTPDTAKLIVWAFIAGFAEKLVPDTLDRLTSKNVAAKPGGTAPPSRPA